MLTAHSWQYPKDINYMQNCMPLGLLEDPRVYFPGRGPALPISQYKISLRGDTDMHL